MAVEPLFPGHFSGVATVEPVFVAFWVSGDVATEFLTTEALSADPLLLRGVRSFLSSLLFVAHRPARCYPGAHLALWMWGHVNV